MAILQEKVGLSAGDVRKIRAMRPGMSLDLQFKTPTSTKRVKTEFVGMDFKRAMIIKFPDENKWGPVRDGIYNGNSLVVRYILEDETGEVIAFKSKVTFMLGKPHYLVFLSFPLAIQNMGLRSEQRKQISIPSRVLKLDSKATIVEAMILDLSTGGCRIGISKNKGKLAKLEEKEVLLKVRGPNNLESDIQAEVKNQRVDDTMVFYGMKFVQSAEVIESILDELAIIY